MIAVKQLRDSIEQPHWIDRNLYPFQSRYVSIEDHRIHYIDEGSGPTLLFLHGAPAWSFLYRNIIKALRNDYRCIALDFPGFGLSQEAPGFRNRLMGNARLVEHFIGTLDLHDITLFGHDAGVSIGLSVLAHRPDRFRAAIISNGFGFPVRDFPSVARFLRVVRSGFFRFMIVHFNFLVRYFVRGVAGGKLSETERDAYRGPFKDRARRHHMHDLLGGILDNHEFLVDLEQRLRALDDLPVLLTFGGADPTYQAGFMQRFEAIFPRHQSVVLEGSDHFPQEHDPDRIVNAIREWWPAMVQIQSK